MALVSLAVAVFFFRNGVPAAENVWRVYIAPIASVLALGGVVIFAILRFDLVVGGAPGQNIWLLSILAASLLFGVAVALYLRTTKPDVYQRLGRRGTGEVDG